MTEEEHRLGIALAVAEYKCRRWEQTAQIYFAGTLALVLIEVITLYATRHCR